jgi:septal ring-binding cell division protein DamX
MNASTRASVSAGMSSRPQTPPGFRRQVVVRLDLEQWSLLEDAVAAHGSIQGAVMAGLRALTTTSEEAAPETERTAAKQEKPTKATPARKAETQLAPKSSPAEDESKEIPAREAAQLLGLKSSTVRSYIRSGRLPGRYDGDPTWNGWMTTREAVARYRSASP